MTFGIGNGAYVPHVGEIARDRDGNRVAKTLSSDMVAHVWANGSQSFGQNGKGTFYFRGRGLWSYGSHYCVGFVLPLEGDPDAWGRALICADSSSVTTNRHVSAARHAARHMDTLRVSDLDRLALAFDRGLSALRSRDKARKADALAGIRSALKDALSWPRADDSSDNAETVAAAVFEAFGDRDALRRARALAAEIAREEKARLVRKEKAERDSLLLTLANRTTNRTPESVAEAIRADAKSAGGNASEIAKESEYWRDLSRELFRAIKAGKAAGHVARVRKAQALRKAIKDSLPLFDWYDLIARKRETWGDARSALRLALKGPDAATMADTESRYRGDGGPNRTGAEMWAEALRKGETGARRLASALNGDSPWAASSARLAGVNVGETADRLRETAERLKAQAEAQEAANRRARKRDALARVRLGVAAMTAEDMTPAHKAATLKAAIHVLESFGGRPAYSWESVPTIQINGKAYRKGHGAMPGAWSVAGWTWERAARLSAALGNVLALVESYLARIAREEKDKARTMALEAWRDREESSLPSAIRRHMPRGDAEGRAFVRARGVVRDESGAIVGGTLETSQGASVPLAHALRVYSFLRLCRERGEAWEANGRVVRVGHFRVDHVTADGGFKAGCHRFAWGEIHALASALGVAEIEPADAREPNAPAMA